MNLSRLLFAVSTTLPLVAGAAEDVRASANPVSGVEHGIIKEPAYQSAPKYCLITLHDRPDAKVWMIEDGKRLFVDKNANGDLTDDGPPITPSNLRTMTGGGWDFDYILDAITPADGSRHTKFQLRRWNYGEKEDSYGLSFSVDGKMPMYAGWFGTFWSTNRETAPIIHFGGPFTPKLLRRNAFTIGETQQRLSLCFVNPGSGAGADSRLSIEALPSFVVPTVTIEWPTDGGGQPLRTSYSLGERCCYWEFYTTSFDMPKNVVPGRVRITVSLPAVANFIELTTTQIVAPVVAASRESAPTK